MSLVFQENTDTYEKMVCASPNNAASKSLKATIKCPKNCKIYELDINQFKINSTGHININATHQYSNVVNLNKVSINKNIINQIKILIVDMKSFRIVMIFFQNIVSKDYCVSYACHQDSLTWEVKADACVCYDTLALKKIDSTIPKEMKRYMRKIYMFNIIFRE